ncbi:uncharacterized protein LOC112127533 [Cimex lectularius]|uniref:Uncharacterized protein n=1 Tax=Cimex lectularius TaxID=79782 RepID=A0A8I6SP60_CIMLE|nr:uncharacterized protein LOC112127533 [Cimex lectularius]
MGLDSGGCAPSKHSISFHEIMRDDNYVVKENKRSFLSESNKSFSKAKLLDNTEIRSRNEQRRANFQTRLAQNRFDDTDMGPFYVLVESRDKNIGKAHPMLFGKWLYQDPNLKNFAGSITEIRATGKNRLKVTASSKDIANYLTETEYLKKENLFTYIPDFLIKKIGVIRDVDLDLSNDEILQHMQSSVQPLMVERMTKFEKSGDKIKIYPLETCLITFKGQRLPEFITIYGGLSRVRPYIPKIRQCNQCLRFNHSANQCRGKLRCPRCSEEHTIENCTNSGVKPVCCNCGKNHLSTSKECEIFKTKSEENKKKHMETSFASVVSSNRFDVLQHLTEKQEEDFPVLPSPTSATPRRQYRKILKRPKLGFKGPFEMNQPKNIPDLARKRPITQSFESNPLATSPAEKYVQILNNLVSSIQDKQNEWSSTDIIDKIGLTLYNLYVENQHIVESLENKYRCSGMDLDN